MYVKSRIKGSHHFLEYTSNDSIDNPRKSFVFSGITIILDMIPDYP